MNKSINSKQVKIINIIPQLVSARNVIFLILMGICIQMAASVILGFVLSFEPHAIDEYAEVMDNLIRYDIRTVCMVVIAAPAFEELIFRYAIMVFGEYLMPFWLANTLQAVLFGVYHGNLIQGIYAFLLGLILGCVAHRLGGIIASLILHMSINAAGLLQSLLVPTDAGVVIRIVFVVVGLAGIVLIMRYGLRRDELRKDK